MPGVVIEAIRKRGLGAVKDFGPGNINSGVFQEVKRGLSSRDSAKRVAAAEAFAYVLGMRPLYGTRQQFRWFLRRAGHPDVQTGKAVLRAIHSGILKSHPHFADKETLAVAVKQLGVPGKHSEAYDVIDKIDEVNGKAKGLNEKVFSEATALKIVSHLKSRDEQVRTRALSALVKVPPKHQTNKVEAAVMKLLNHRNPGVVADALSAYKLLVLAGPLHADANTEKMVEAKTRHRDEKVRERAASTLATIRQALGFHEQIRSVIGKR
jgi:hypothetical protein